MPWAKPPPDPAYPPPPDSVAPGHVAVTFVGHATFLLRFPGLVVLTDPVWSERCSPVLWAGPRRVRPPGLALDALPPVDLVLVSHNHYDHMDLPTLRHLAARGDPPVVTSAGNAPILRRAGFTRVTALDWWDAAQAGPTPGHGNSRAALLPTRPVRHEPHPVGRLPHGGPGRPRAVRPATRAPGRTGRRSRRGWDRPAWRCSRSAPTSRAG